ncbi:MAG: hypothetical protein LBD85_04395, partial [Oscillospiraceae bacterium]|nr:hypothetical protein [Oscillospiraceae bacterium]
MFENKVITDAGLELYAEAVSKTLTLTRVEIGSHYTPPDELAALTVLEDVIKGVPITQSQVKIYDKVTEIWTQINNSGISERAELRQVGIYAEVDSGEALFAVLQTGEYFPIQIPAQAAEMPTFTIDLSIPIAHGSAANVTAILDLSAYVTVGELEAAVRHLVI